MASNWDMEREVLVREERETCILVFFLAFFIREPGRCQVFRVK